AFDRIRSLLRPGRGEIEDNGEPESADTVVPIKDDFWQLAPHPCDVILRSHALKFMVCLSEERVVIPDALTSGQKDLKHAKHYVAAAKTNMVLKAAARAWAHGVPWAEAYNLCDEALKKAADQMKFKAIPKGKAKAKASGRRPAP
ncbi:unnamed protein product, partial [Durusdinium trenchii]